MNLYFSINLYIYIFLKLTSKVTLGFQLRIFLALVESPNNKSTSVGRKYRASTLTLIIPVALSFPTSSTPLPSQLI